MATVANQPSSAGACRGRAEADSGTVTAAVATRKVADVESGVDDVETCGAARRVEARVCATSTGWGLLAGRPTWVLVLFWLFRHAIYFAIAAALLVFVGGSTVAIALSVFFIYVHTHKAILFFRLQSEKKAAAEASEKGVP